MILEKGLKQITDPDAITTVIEEVLAGNPKIYEQYKAARKPPSASSSVKS